MACILSDKIMLKSTKSTKNVTYYKSAIFAGRHLWMAPKIKLFFCLLLALMKNDEEGTCIYMS